jgi:phosphopantetheine adenylyltransferase
VLFFTEPALSPISSTIIRDIIRNDGDVSQFVPAEVRSTKKIQQQLSQL